MSEIKEVNEAYFQIPLLAKTSQVEEILRQYPMVEAKLNEFFNSENFFICFEDMMRFVDENKSQFDLSDADIESLRSDFLVSLKVNTKVNILSNALKYTKKGKISIYMSKSRPHTLVIEDTGIGIRAEDLPRVFEKGFTGYNGREENRSTGIGLYLCGKIMKRLDHGIRIESELGKGTKVFLELGRKKMNLY